MDHGLDGEAALGVLDVTDAAALDAIQLGPTTITFAVAVPCTTACIPGRHIGGMPHGVTEYVWHGSSAVPRRAAIVRFASRSAFSTGIRHRSIK